MATNNNINYAPAAIPGTVTTPVLGNNIDRAPAPVDPGAGTGVTPMVTAPVIPVTEQPVLLPPTPTRTTSVVLPVAEVAVDTTANADAVSGTNIPAANQQRYLTILANGVVVTNNAATLDFEGNGFTITTLGTNGATITLSGGAGYGNSNVATLLAAFGSNTLSTTGNVTGGYILGNGSQLTGLSATYGNANVATFLAAFGSNTIVTTGNVTGGNLLTGGVVSFTGGSRLSPLGANLDIFAGAGAYVNLTTSDESSRMGVDGSGGYITTAGGTWGFGTSGNLTAPGNISAVGNITAGNILARSVANVGNLTLTAGANAWVFGTDGILTLAGGATLKEGVALGALALGYQAGETGQGIRTVAIGQSAGQTSQSARAIAIGLNAGSNSQGSAAVAIGAFAGATSQGTNSIILNATGANLDQTTANTFTVAPVRNDVANTAEVMFYNATSKEVTYGNVISVAGNITGGNLTVGSGTITGGNVNGANFNGNVAFGTGTVGGSGNITGGNLLFGSGVVSGTGNITGGNILGGANVNATTHTGTTASLSGNVTGGNIITAGIISATGTITSAGNLSLTGNIVDIGEMWINTSSNGNINLNPNGTGNVNIPAGVLSVTGNITGGNISTAGNITGNTAGFAIGYRDIPQISLASNVTTALTDAGKHYYSTSASNLALTIANNTSVSWAVGTAISIVNRGTANITIAPGSGVSLYLAGNSTSANRTVTTYGMATVMNVAANIWMINGTVV